MESQTLNCLFDPFPNLETDRLVLRQIQIADDAEVFFLRSDAQVMQYIDRKPAQSIDEAHDFIKRVADETAQGNSINWAITAKPDDKLIGTIAFWRMQKEHFRAEIGYWLHPHFWGKGLMKEALSKVVAYGFETMNLHSIEANINPKNTASARLLESSGFVREGYFRENYYYDGRFLDSVIYSLVKTTPQ